MSLTKKVDKQTPQMKCFQEFLGRYSFVTPNYQRSYKWQPEQVADFFSSINELLEQNLHLERDESPYQLFFGTVMLTENKNRHLIIDGQQRCITFMLFLSKLKEIIDEEIANALKYNKCNHPDTEEARRNRVKIEELLYAKEIRGGSVKHEIRTDLFDKNDNAVLKWIIDKKNDEPKKYKMNRVYKNYNLIANRLADLLCSNYFNSFQNFQILGRLNYVCEQVLKNIYFLVMTLDDQSEAFAIFESLNNTGLDLTPFDLINGHIASELRDRKLLDEWEELILTYKQDKVPLDNYVFYWWQSKGNNTPKIDLFNKVKEYCKVEGISKCVTELIKAFEILYDFYYLEQSYLSQYFKLLSRTKIVPLLLSLKYGNYSNNEIQELLTRIIKYSVIELNFLGRSPGTFQYKLKSILSRILDSNRINKKLLFAEIIKLCPDIQSDIKNYNNIFKRLLDGEIYDSQLMKCLFYMIMETENNSDIKLEFENFDLEHIFPQNPDDAWYQSELWEKYKGKDAAEERGKIQNYFGNLMLLKDKINRSTKNSYITKKEGSIKENIKADSYLNIAKWNKIDFENFSPNYIITRTQKLVDIMNNLKVFEIISSN